MVKGVLILVFRSCYERVYRRIEGRSKSEDLIEFLVKVITNILGFNFSMEGLFFIKVVFFLMLINRVCF